MSGPPHLEEPQAPQAHRSLPTRGLPPSIRRHSLPAASILLVTLLMGWLAWRVSADEHVQIGAEADRIYIVDGFYEPERSSEHGLYRWAHPLAQVRLPNVGPGRMRVRAEGIGGAGGSVALKLEGNVIDQAATASGAPWRLEGWGETHSSTPALAIESAPYTPPGEGRLLGVLVKRLEIYAPQARLFAWVHIALLGMAGLLLYLLLAHAAITNSHIVAAVAGAAIPALLGPLAAYRDPWVAAVAWTSPLALGVALLLISRVRLRVVAPGGRLSRARAALLTLALTAALLLLYLGYMNAFDADRMYQMAAGLAEYGRPSRYPGLDTYTKYGFGQSLIAVPFYLLGKVGEMLGGSYEPVTRLAVSLTNLPVTALTVLLLYRASRRYAGVTPSLLVAATYLLSTPALNYGRTFFSEPAGGLLLLAALLLLLPSDDDAGPLKWRAALLAGICLGAMLLFKPAFAIYWLPAGMLSLWRAFSFRPSGGAAPSWLGRLLPAALVGIGPLVALAIQAWYNYLRYSPLPDAIFRTGYEKEEGFNTPLLEGLGGLLFSPGKSIFLYAPVLLLAPLGLWLMFRRHGSAGQTAALVISAMIALGFAVNAMWWAWTGNFAWGPRLVVPVLPLMVWLLAPVGSRLERPAQVGVGNRLLAASWLLLGVLGALVNIPGAMLDFQVYYRNYGLLLAGEPGEAITIYEPAHSPILVETGYMLDGLTAAIYRPSLASVGMPPLWDVIVPGALVLASVTLLWAALHERPSQRGG